MTVAPMPALSTSRPVAATALRTVSAASSGSEDRFTPGAIAALASGTVLGGGLGAYAGLSTGVLPGVAGAAAGVTGGLILGMYLGEQAAKAMGRTGHTPSEWALYGALSAGAAGLIGGAVLGGTVAHPVAGIALGLVGACGGYLGGTLALAAARS